MYAKLAGSTPSATHIQHSRELLPNQTGVAGQMVSCHRGTHQEGPERHTHRTHMYSQMLGTQPVHLRLLTQQSQGSHARPHQVHKTLVGSPNVLLSSPAAQGQLLHEPLTIPSN